MKEVFFRSILLLLLVGLSTKATAATVYSIGNPTDEEQMYVEWMNRARANPAAESLRLAQSTNLDVRNGLMNVDTNLMIAQFAVIAPAPPLSINAQLTAAARLHSGHMFTNVYQGHQGPGELDFAERVLGQAYDYSALAENVYAFARSVEHGHAGFNVDWGTNGSTGRSVGGMQDPAGHRRNIHSGSYREVGVGVVLGSRTSGSTTVGPQLVTQDFGSRHGLGPFITGVAYFDLNTNNFYDIGEGIGGAAISVSGTGVSAVSASSGGYSVPVIADGIYTVSFTGGNFVASNVTATIQNLQNTKVDLVLPYVAPAATFVGTLFSGQNNAVTITPTAFADSYLVHQSRLLPYAGIEGAESTNNLTINSSAGYTVVDSSVKASGNFSFHLAHAQPVPQTVTFTKPLRLKPNSSITFKSRLGWASASQKANVRMSSDDGATWQTIWTQAGTGNSGESTFKDVTINLSHAAGKVVRFRLVYEIIGSSFFPQTQSGVGWYADDFRVLHGDEVSGTVLVNVPSNQFTFAPATAGNYLISIQPRVAGRLFPPLPQEISVANGSFSARITAVEMLPNRQVRLTFTSGTPEVTVQSRVNVTGAWNPISGLNIQTLPNSTYQVLLPATMDSSRFFRLGVGL